jgi:hypothetical protein
MTNRFRWLGIFPSGVILIHLFVLWPQGQAAGIFWICNLSDLALGLGLLLNQPQLIRPAAFWLLFGLPFWAWYVITTGDYEFTSFLTHIGGTCIALIALWRVRVDQWSWAAAIAGFLVVQLLCRLLTPPEMNINVAHNLRSTIFENSAVPYWQFWMISTLIAASSLWLINVICKKIFPLPSLA